MSATGFYGKLPAAGDFVQRRVPAAFVEPWDTWLQAMLAGSRALLADRWLPRFLTAPCWRFALGREVLGAACAGVLAPSVDRAGRYFPLTVVVPLPADTLPLAFALTDDPWYSRAEHALLELLEAEAMAPDEFGERLALLPAPSGSSPLPALAAALERAAPGAAAQGVWWTIGAAPDAFRMPALPGLDEFVRMLGPATADGAADAADADPLAALATPLEFASAGATDAGRVRTRNEDAWVERTAIGVWAVADGLGGSAHGDVASRLVCDALVAAAGAVSLAAQEHEVRAALSRANAELRRMAARPIGAVDALSTVAALVLRGSRGAVLWAGDSRVYRCRQGIVEPLTRDHAAVAEAGATAGAPRGGAIERAVGGEDDLDLDVARFDVRAGDRFLLCTDGLWSELDAALLAGALAVPGARAACEALLRAALATPARDNLTAVVVDALQPGGPSR